MDYYTHTIECCNPNELFCEEIMEICRKQIARMPELRRQILTANKFEGMSYKEIADRNGITTTRVDNELRKALNTLRLSLKDYLMILAILFLNIKQLKKSVTFVTLFSFFFPLSRCCCSS